MLIELGYNERRIIEALRIGGSLPRNRLAEITMLTPPTLTRLSTNLIKAGLLQEAERIRDGGRGHPPQLLELAADGGYSIGISLSPDSLSVCLIDFLGTVLVEDRQKLVDFQPEAVANFSLAAIGKILTTFPKVGNRLLGVGITLPGDFNVVQPFINPVREFESWASLDIASFLSGRLDLPVWHDNDGNAAILSEAYFGVGRDFNDFALIYLSHGIGGGLMLGRHLHRGAHGNAAEFGGLFPTNLPRPSGRDLIRFLVGKNISVESLESLDVAAIKPAVLDEWISRAAEQLIPAVRILFKTIDPQAIVLGGIMPKAIIEGLASHLSSIEIFDARRERNPPSIVVSNLIGRGPYLGAATLPLYNLMAPSDYLGRALKEW